MDDAVERDRQEAQVREAERERAFDHTPQSRLTDEEWERHMATLNARLREADPLLADAIDAEERGERRLTDEERARLDAYLTGTGYVVNGRYVRPSAVLVFRYRGCERMEWGVSAGGPRG